MLVFHAIDYLTGIKERILGGLNRYGWKVFMSYYDEAAEKLIAGMGRMHGNKPFERMGRFSKGEAFALNMLDMHGDTMSAGDMGEHMHVSSARIAAVLGKLEDKGYIERRIDKDDRRRIEVVLTELGRRCAKEHRDEMKSKFANTFKRMGKKDTEEFIRLASKFFTLAHKEWGKSNGDI
jgi:DNA-binding MarR family transcriptional regulator